MIVVFILAMIAGVCIMLRNITDIKPIDVSSSNTDAVETISTELSTTVETTSITTSSTVTSSLTSTATSTSYAETEIETSGVSTVITTTEDIIISIINPQIIVIPDETSKATTKTTKTTTVTTTTYSVNTITTTTTVSSHDSQTIDNTFGKQFVGTFQGTYYVYPQGTHGGSGRELIDCSIGNGEVKGSISSRSLFNQFKYNINGRTMVYIESESCKSLCGYYYLDDSTREDVLGVIDFFYNCEENSPFCGIGRLYDINVYV